jgi:hypothetical protein
MLHVVDRVSPKVDIWALGCVMMVLATNPEFPYIMHEEWRLKGQVMLEQWLRTLLAGYRDIT